MSGLQPTQPDASSRSAAGETAADTISGQTHISTARPSVSISVLLFASLRDAARADQIVVQVECQRTHCAGQNAAITVAALLEHCALQYPQLAPWLPHVRVAVNCEYADNECLIVPGDEVALLPPVSGGASK